MSIDTFLLSADTTDLNYPEVRPTLDLNFARVKALDPRITFTRSSGGSYVGADGLIKYAGVNEARFDHDPVTGESLGLLIEEQRSNLLLNSEDIGEAGWSTLATVSTNVAISPDGTTTANTISSTGMAIISRFITKAASSIIYTATLFVRGSLPEPLSLTIDDGGISNRGRAVFNLSSGSFSIINDGDFTNTSASFTEYPNNWKKITVTTTTNTQTTVRFRFFWISLESTLDVWGAQLEQGAFPTSYIPTVASTRTRAADNASITGKNFSEWYRQDEGTFVVGVPKASGIYVWSTARVLNVFGPRFQLGAAGDFAMVNDVSAVPFQMGVSPSYPKRIASAYKLGNYAQSNEGRLVFSTANTICTGQTVLQIGTLVNSFLSGTISRLTYYPKRLPNAQLQALTR